MSHTIPEFLANFLVGLTPGQKDDVFAWVTAVHQPLAFDIMEATRPTKPITSTQTPEEFIRTMNVHPSIVAKYLTKLDGSLRIPGYEEWNEDFGLGYANRMAWEGKAVKI